MNQTGNRVENKIENRKMREIIYSTKSEYFDALTDIPDGDKHENHFMENEMMTKINGAEIISENKIRVLSSNTRSVFLAFKKMWR